MSRRSYHNQNAQAQSRNRGLTKAADGHRAVGRRGIWNSDGVPFSPPEDWYEPTGRSGFVVVSQDAGEGYRHVVTEEQIRERLAELPAHMLEDLEVVQLSRMTRKKQTLPCYGMQWGCALYLYPVEATLVELFFAPPRPAFVTETRMYGGRWQQLNPTHWQLLWTESAICDYYLNNILIHELGHLLDDRNTNCTDRERYAEWFALEHGYKASRAKMAEVAKKRVRRRHHSS
ncbi:MAG: hypothetical protein ACI9G1_001435 [Pirellulaceae bacterium]|jgi:hypothetical protein